MDRTQIGKRPPLSPPLREAAGATLAIDAATRANLELTRTQAGERRGALLDAIDRTVTAAGARLLAQRLAAPLTDPEAIARRLDAVGRSSPKLICALICARASRQRPTLARSLARLVVGRGGPRDLAAVRDGLRAATESPTASLPLRKPPEFTAAIDALRRPVAPLRAELAARAC